MKMAAEIARKKLLKYYNKITPLYCVVAALDPRINLEYFRNEGWDEQYIEDWKLLMEEIWENYKPSNVKKITPEYPFLDDDESFVNSIYKRKHQRLTSDDELEW